MCRVCRRFERWRNGRKGRLPLPEALWAAAAAAARAHGVFQTAKVLCLDYSKLKRMAAVAPPIVRPTAKLPLGATTFMELTSSPAASSGPDRVECYRVGRPAGQDAHPVESELSASRKLAPQGFTPSMPGRGDTSSWAGCRCSWPRRGSSNTHERCTWIRGFRSGMPWSLAHVSTVECSRSIRKTCRAAWSRQRFES